jgi:multidrug efflux pump
VPGVLLFVYGLPRELSPIEDRGTVLTIGIAPEGSTIDYTDRYAKRIEENLSAQPETDKVFQVIGFGNDVGRVISFARLTDWEEREAKQQEVTARVAPMMFAIPGLQAFASNPPSLGQNPTEKPVQFVLQTSQDYSVLQAAADRMLAAARGNPGLSNVDTDLKLNKPQLNVTIDREKAALLGIGVETVGRTVETMLGGRQVTRFKRNGKQYDVVLQVRAGARSTPTTSRRSTSARRRCHGAAVELVKVEETVAPKDLAHFNKLRSATINAQVAPGYSLGEALAFFEQEAQSLPPGVLYDFKEQSREYRRPRPASRSCSAWPCCSSTWCWRPSSRAGSTRSSSCSPCRWRWRVLPWRSSSPASRRTSTARSGSSRWSG